MVVVFSNRNNYIITNFDAVIVSNVVIVFIHSVKFYATVNVIQFEVLIFSVDRRFENYTKILSDKHPWNKIKVYAE